MKVKPWVQVKLAAGCSSPMTLSAAMALPGSTSKIAATVPRTPTLMARKASEEGPAGVPLLAELELQLERAAGLIAVRRGQRGDVPPAPEQTATEPARDPDRVAPLPGVAGDHAEGAGPR